MERMTGKRKRTTSWLVLAVAALLIVGSIRVAQARRGGRGFGFSGSGMGHMGHGFGHGGHMGAGAGNDGPMGHGFGHGGRMWRGLRNLELTDEQTQMIQDLMQETRDANAETRQQVWEARDALHELLLAEEPDVEAINMKVGEILALRSGLMSARSATRLKVLLEILTSEQRQTFLQNMERHGHNKEKRGS